MSDDAPGGLVRVVRPAWASDDTWAWAMRLNQKSRLEARRKADAIAFIEADERFREWCWRHAHYVRNYGEP